jgi:hypothetical protein
VIQHLEFVLKHYPQEKAFIASEIKAIIEKNNKKPDVQEALKRMIKA